VLPAPTPTERQEMQRDTEQVNEEMALTNPGIVVPTWRSRD